MTIIIDVKKKKLAKLRIILVIALFTKQRLGSLWYSYHYSQFLADERA